MREGEREGERKRGVELGGSSLCLLLLLDNVLFGQLKLFTFN